MKKILFYLCFSLLTLLVSCNNREEAPAKQEDKEATKARIRNILVSNGIDESSIRFFDATEADKKNAIVISSLEEFEQMMKEGRKQDSISRKEHDEFLKRKKEDSINENSQKKNLNNKRINNNSLWWNDNWNSNDDYGVDDFSFRKRLDLPVFDLYLIVDILDYL